MNLKIMNKISGADRGRDDVAPGLERETDSDHEGKDIK